MYNSGMVINSSQKLSSGHPSQLQAARWPEDLVRPCVNKVIEGIRTKLGERVEAQLERLTRYSMAF
ncbi:TPA: hypothetical protein ACH3X3_007895 [Trebouxia sp. C0006]